jgi:hypothetical protein
MKTISGLVWVAMICLGCGGSTLKQGPSGGKASGGQGGGWFSTGVGSGGSTAGIGGIASGGHAGSSPPGVDGGVVEDAAPDACLVPTCDVLPSCPAGQTRTAQPCACPVCVPDDAGQPDVPICPPTCPAVKCAYGSVRDPVCGCSICIAPDAGIGLDLPPVQDASRETMDAGTDAEAMACVGLDECACWNTKGCAAVAESCYCPYPQCGHSGACFCAGGKYFGCAPEQLEECTAAKTHVSKLCPSLSGPIFDGLCKGTDNACVTKCLKEVNACGDISCSMCRACDCVSDAFTKCRGACQR